MYVYRSNRAEQLVDALAGVVSKPLGSPFAEELVVVSSQGMERWLSQQLSIRLGVFANARFPFPRAFMDELLGSAPADPDAFSRDALVWSIAGLLPSVAQKPGAEAVAAYLANDAHGEKLFDLAEQVANAFDQYLVYRPALVRAWERGAGRGFQPDLFRALVDRYGASHLAARAEAFLSAELPAGLPERVSVFGASTLPRLYVRLLSRLAREREVHVFLLRASRPQGGDHPLSHSLGALARDFETVLAEEAGSARLVDMFVDPRGRTMLEVVQADMLSGTHREPGSAVATRVVVKPGDLSIAVHSCHGPLREVEVLRDQLLAAFESDPTLEPEDVIVMAPNIDDYAPLVDAVFGLPAEDPGFIPYRIADRRVRAANPTADALLSVLDLAGGRMKASDVLDLLQLEPVRARFEIDAESLPELRRLVRRSGIRFGIDGRHREELGQPGHAENTWRFGLDRLLLGQALETDDAAFGDTLPWPLPNAEAAELVGKLSEAAEAVFAERDSLRAPRSPDEWARALSGALDALVSNEEPHLSFAQATRDAVARFADLARAAGYAGAMHREAVLPVLSRLLDREKSGRSFLAGGVTFCALLPMRSIPFRVVYLLGLGDTVFPRRNRAPAFDLMAEHPEPGDRSSREEDRLLFLESVLSARERLVLSYVGRAAHDNAKLSPSAVVSELLDTLDRTFTTAAEKKGQPRLAFDDHRVAPDGIGRRTIVEHPLQSFSARYFGASDDPRLFSYGDAEAEGARSLAARAQQAERFAGTALEDAHADVLDLSDLVRFLENPARGFIRRRLGVVLEDEPPLVSDRDPVELEPLDTYELGARLYERLAAGSSEGDAAAWARGLGLAPPGTPGDVDVQRVMEVARRLYAEAKEWLTDEPSPPLAVDLSLDGTRLVGVLRDVRPRGQAFVRFARLKPKNELAAWVRHLALCASTEGAARSTLVLGRAMNDGTYTEGRVFSPVDPRRARALLADLARLHRLGQRAPLSLFPSASKIYAQKVAEGPGRERSALFLARNVFRDRKAGAEAGDVYVRRAFVNTEPLAPEPVPLDDEPGTTLPSFAEASVLVFGPLLAASKAVST